MENFAIAAILNGYADLLELKEKNRFRIGSYRRAAQTVQSCPQPLAGLVERGDDITQMAGIGTSMAEHIKEIVATGTLQALTDLHKEFPGTISDLLKLEGLGPKRVKQLHNDLGVNSLEELENAIESGRVQKLPGFAKKSVEKIRAAIARFAKRPGRFKLADAEQLVRPLIEYLQAGSDVERLEVAGSYRRRMETVGDIDILTTGKRPARVMQRFQSYPEVERVLGAGSTRGTVILRSGLQVDLRIVPDECFGAALCYFTGSKAHNVALRTLGVERKLRINEYGIFDLKTRIKTKDNEEAKGKRIGGVKEEEVYRAVGL
ncbi:MAG: type-X family DNA polymerase, partial [Deltaproteobacteria bacterium]|nr:type-X family DNA polymerase [Deltaproteobacteria bacterium]